MDTQVFSLISIAYGFGVNFYDHFIFYLFLLAAVQNIMISVFPPFEFRMRLLLRSHICKRLASLLIALIISASVFSENKRTVSSAYIIILQFLVSRWTSLI